MANPQPWWKNAVIYQIYPRSFQDSNGDGIGDLAGIIQRLGYLESLGIDAIWLSPVYRSPQDDNGYDISDYCDIDPMFGTLADMDNLITEAKKHHIRIIMDLVLNHSSDEHRWFQEAKKSRDNPYHDYYVWRDGVEGTPPNKMRATFGGSAWTWVPEVGQYYFHQFSIKQPDLNWDNPALRQELYKAIRFWMDKGVGGFRLDVIDQIAKDPDLGITSNGPMLHAYLRELNANTFGSTDLVTVGEAWGANVQNAPIFSDPRGKEFSMVFQFEHIGLDQIPGKAKWDLAPLQLSALKEVLTKWQVGLHGKGWNSLFWNNHDLPRIVSRWGNDGAYRQESAKMLATLLHGMQGTPYIYQGEELGMTNVAFPTIDDYRDIETLNMYRERTQAGYSEADILRSLHAKSSLPETTPAESGAAANTDSADTRQDLQLSTAPRRALWLLAVPVVMLAAATVAFILHRRRVLGLDTRRPCAERVLAIFAAIYAQLVRRGLPAGTSSDERAFPQFLLKEVHELSGGEIEAMVSLAQRAAFAADTLTEEDVAAMRGWYNRIKNNKKT